MLYSQLTLVYGWLLVSCYNAIYSVKSVEYRAVPFCACIRHGVFACVNYYPSRTDISRHGSQWTLQNWNPQVSYKVPSSNYTKSNQSIGHDSKYWFAEKGNKYFQVNPADRKE